MMYMGFLIMREVSPQEVGFQYQEMMIENYIKKIQEKKITKNLFTNLKHKVNH